MRLLRGFTLLELVIVLIIIGIFSTLGVAWYGKFLDDSRASLCQANLEALKAALDVYAMEHDSLPADLSKLPPETIERAYAQILKDGGLRLQLAYLADLMDQRQYAYAADFLKNVAGGNVSVTICPVRKLQGGGISYGLNVALQSISYLDYQLLPALTPLVADANGSTFSATALGVITGSVDRHPLYGSNATGSRALAVLADGFVYEYRGGVQQRLRPKKTKDRVYKNITWATVKAAYDNEKACKNACKASSQADGISFETKQACSGYCRTQYGKTIDDKCKLIATCP